MGLLGNLLATRDELRVRYICIGGPIASARVAVVGRASGPRAVGTSGTPPCWGQLPVPPQWRQKWRDDLERESFPARPGGRVDGDRRPGEQASLPELLSCFKSWGQVVTAFGVARSWSIGFVSRLCRLETGSDSGVGSAARAL